MTELRVFTLNCWGLKFVSSHRVERMSAIGHELSQSNYDIVVLQEVWLSKDYITLQKLMFDSFPCSHYFDNGIIGSGTCVFTRVQIQRASFHEFAMNGYPQNIFHGDWFAAKGLGLCQIYLRGFNIHIYTSHYHAEYNPLRDVYLGHRCIHALESAQWIHLTSSSADLTIYAGDFNTEPTGVPYKIVRYVTPMRDTWVEVHENDETNGSTNETSYNSYTPKSVKKSCPEGKRIDYIMYRPGPNIKAVTLECSLPLSHRVPGKDFSFSDHEAVAATIQVSRNDSKIQSSFEFQKEFCSEYRNDCVLTVEKALAIVQRSKRWVSRDQRRYIAYSVLIGLSLIASFLFTVFTAPSFHLFLDLILFIPRGLCMITFVFFILMATLFNQRERHALDSTKKYLELIYNVEKKPSALS